MEYVKYLLWLGLGLRILSLNLFTLGEKNEGQVKSTLNICEFKNRKNSINYKKRDIREQLFHNWFHKAPCSCYNGSDFIVKHK